MAGTGDIDSDIQAHEDSYLLFFKWFRNGTIAVAIIAATVVFIITR